MAWNWRQTAQGQPTQSPYPQMPVQNPQPRGMNSPAEGYTQRPTQSPYPQMPTQNPQPVQSQPMPTQNPQPVPGTNSPYPQSQAGTNSPYPQSQAGTNSPAPVKPRSKPDPRARSQAYQRALGRVK